jgi:hypothetical protein
LADEAWNEAAHRLRALLTQRPTRFVIDFRQARALSQEIARRWPDAPAEAANAGDTILAGRHQLLGYAALSFAHAGRPTDWHYDPVHERCAPRRFWADVPFLDPACGDHKVIWELNRQQYFLTLGRAWWLTGDDRYSARITRDIHDWLDANPPLVGINWASMLELGFRSLSWVTATHLLLADLSPATNASPSEADATWLLDVCVGLDRQLTHVERHLSRYFSPNTHLTGEALALYVVGVALPELTGSRRWTQIGKSVLLHEIDSQIRPDGGHAELSTCYHRYTLDFYSLALMTAELEGDSAAADAFRDAVVRLRRYMHVFTAGDGTIPLIGDEDGGQLWSFPSGEPRDVRSSLALAAALTDSAETGADMPEEALWLAWNARPAVRQRRMRPIQTGGNRPKAPVGSQHFPDSGYVVVHTEHGDHLTFDTGVHGYLNGGHAHADALSITLHLQSRPLLIDPGSATYTMDAELRTRLRESASHNTVTVGRRSSAIPRGPFQWLTRADGRLESFVANPRFVVAEGTHNGYAPAVHRRVIVHGEGTGWIVSDVVSGSEACLDAHWHFDPAWHVEASGTGRLLATGPTGARAWLLHTDGAATIYRGDDTRGWCSPRYGALVPTFSARIHRDDAVGPPLTTWIGIEDDAPDPQIALVPADDDSSARPAVRLTHDNGTILTIIDLRATRPPRYTTYAGVTSDARILQVTTSRDETVTFLLVDGHHVALSGLPLLDVTSGERLADLWLRSRGDLLELWTTSPPASLRLRFLEGHRARRLRLNGRDVLGLVRGDDLVIVSSSWNHSLDGLAAWPSHHVPSRAQDGIATLNRAAEGRS